MTEIDDGIQAAFDRMRRDVRGTGIGPPAGEIVRRARRRRRARMAAAGVTAIVVAVGALTLQSAGHHDRQVVTPPKPARPLPKSNGKALRITDLIYGAAARKDRGHWSENHMVSAGVPLAQPAVPVCIPNGENPWTEEGPTAGATGFDLAYAPAPDRRDSDNQRGEQVMSLRGTAAAEQTMRLILRYAQACGTTATIRRLAIADEALSISHTYRPDGYQQPATENAIAVRRGNALAVYWDFHRGGTRALATMAQHERDAQVTAGRLCALGFGC